jgi:hypothetical protein
MLIYRIRIPDQPKPVYVEVREDQLVLLPTPAKVKPSPFAADHSAIPTPPKVKPRRSAGEHSQGESTGA